MEEIHALSKLQELNLDIANLPVHELAQFLDLVSTIKTEDYETAINFVLTRKKLEDKPAFDKFKYLCGYLQKIKKIYHYQTQYGKTGLD